MRRGPRSIAAGLLVLVVAGCRTYDDAALPTTAATTVAPTTTTLPPTTTTTLAPTTSAAPPTPPAPPPTSPPPPPSPPPAPAPVVAAAQRVPVAPPAEDGSTEPRVEVGTIAIPKIGLVSPMWEGIKLSTL